MKRDKRKRYLCFVLAAATTMSLCTGAGASSLDELQQSIQDLQRAQEELNQNLNNSESVKNSLQDYLQEANEQVENQEQKKQETEQKIQELDDQIGVIAGELSALEAQTAQKQQEIEKLKESLATANERLGQQYEAMKARIRYMYEHGNDAYISVLFSAGSAADMLSKLEYIAQMSRYDREKLQEYQDAVDLISASTEKLSQDEAILNALTVQVEEKKAAAETLLAQKNQELALQEQNLQASQSLAQQYEQQIEYQDNLIAQLEGAQAANLSQQDEAIAALTRAIAEAEEAQKAAAEQAAAQAVLQKLAQIEQDVQASLNGDGSYNIVVDPNTLFVWPCPNSTRITSEYGWRVHPIYGDNRFHSGIDIGADFGSPIIAAYQGTVISAGYNTSMGNYVMIDHGEGLVTIYMHASYLCVSEGQTVTTGQLIALVGSTGDSTGNHLHFSTRLNGNYVSPWNYVQTGN